MLNKNLLRYRIKKNEIIPKFVDANNQQLLKFTQALLNIYLPSRNEERLSLEKESSDLVKNTSDKRLFKGLEKVIYNQCEFNSLVDTDTLRETRKDVFKTSAELLKSGKDISYKAYKQEIIQKNPKIEYQANYEIYSDLPERDILVSRNISSPEEVSHKYNITLIQSLLLYSDELRIRIYDEEIKKLRKFINLLKFFRLLISISTINYEEESTRKTTDDGIEIIINGPLSLFEKTQSYGLQLASTIPALCKLSKWNLEADVKLNTKTYTLSLDHNSKLQSQSKFLLKSYIPKEFDYLLEQFNKQSDNWKIKNGNSFIDAGGQKIIFPDFTFINLNSNKKVHLELFHKWHASQLVQRLDTLKQKNLTNYIIAVDRFIYNKPNYKSSLENNSIFQKYGLLFSELPTINNVLKKLKEFN